MKDKIVHAPPIGLDRDLHGATAEQRHVHDMIANGPRGGVPSPFLAMLDAPDLAVAIQNLGVAIRFKGHLSDAQRELAILATAGAAGCGYEWHYHASIGAKAGLDGSTINATLPGAGLEGVENIWAIIITLCQSVATREGGAENALHDAIAAFGRRAATELVAIIGYYTMLAHFIKLGGHDRPFDVQSIGPQI
jgi:4-carboxymuconolactone decarboxylase